jgi:aminocarboxymuconate-semialdehyde decarboxylase
VSNENVSIIDVHSHFYPRWYIDLLRSRTALPKVTEDADGEKFVIFAEEEQSQEGGRLISDEYWSLDAKISFMERFGIDQTILSLGNPWLDPFDGAEGLDTARYFNNDFAKLRAQTHGRILGMGAIPGHNISDIVTVIYEIADTEDLFGLITGSRIGGLTFDDPKLDPVWAALQATGTPVLIHPHHGSGMEELEGFGHAMPVAIGFPLETTIALARLIFGGVLHRYPGVRLVGSHGGGTLPFLAGRLDAGWQSDPRLIESMPTPPSAVTQQLFLDAVLYHPRALHAAADLVGVDHLMFGTDHPFSISDPAVNIAAIRDAFSKPDAMKVLAGAAIDLYDVKHAEQAMQ